MKQEYRDGPVGALMDEYERAASELKEVLRAVDPDTFLKIVDSEASDPDCRSIQTIVHHVVRAGYGYTNYIRSQFGDTLKEDNRQREISSPEIAFEEIDNMLAYTLQTLDGKWNLSPGEVISNKMQTSWGQEYDFEQLFEHAIVHILRHRRQIERFLSDR